VFARANGGFDAIVGNPPFAGKNTISGARAGYLDWLKQIHEGSHGNADLVAHFFRRAFDLLRRGGALGLLATNTIAQGDTRSTGLGWICTHGGTIIAARRRRPWPGSAAVVVSEVHVVRGEMPGPYLLDDRSVPSITAFLCHAGGHEGPAALPANAGQSFIGSYLLGMGFTFDDTDRSGKAGPLREMQRLIAADPRNAERIFPYLGGEELNASPTQAPHRYAINFGALSEEEARRWPDLLALVEQKVKPERLRQKRAARRRYWWRYAEAAPALYRAIQDLPRVLAVSRIGQQAAFAFLPGRLVYAETLVVFALSTNAAFCALQSRVHEVWARFFGSSLKDDLRYTPSDCFETFPFPVHFATDPRLEEAGKVYDECRAALMVANDEGLTKTYTRFHDPAERSPAVLRLRELHATLDRAVLDAYGWTDLKPTCTFLLDYEHQGGQRRKPYRYRWSDEVRDEVLARLLALNRQRHQGQPATSGRPGRRSGRRGTCCSA
jgi:hypothetical protein